MERPAQRYFCNKCGYVGNVDLHSGCGYLAYHLAPFEQNYIDQLERELALLKASPAGAPEVTDGMALAFHHALTDGAIGQSEVDEIKTGLCAALAAAPTQPVSECVDPVMTKEDLIAAAESIGMRFPGASIPPVSEDRKDAERFRFLQEDKP